MFRKIAGTRRPPAAIPADTKGLNAHNTQGTATQTREAINIIVCGQTGAGKSSLVNMLAGVMVATTYNDVAVCTSKSDSYTVTTPSNRKITLWDTPGLDQWLTRQGTSSTAMENLRERAILLTESTGLSLVIFMIRGRPTHDVIKDYVSFKAFCNNQVAFALVVTGLDGESDRAAWWSRNESYFHQAGLLNDGHACIISTKELNPYTYAESGQEVFKLIEDTAYLRDPWKAYKPQNIQPNKPLNIIVCGQAGVGKSSIINMLVGQPVAKTSDEVVGCTFRSDQYSALFPGNHPITLWDTAGLDEASTGRVSAFQAMKNIHKMTSQLAGSTGLSLIIYVVKGKLAGSIVKNYLLFKALCEDRVPLALIVTGLDDISDKAAWWKKNEHHFKKAGLHSAGHACIVAVKQAHTVDAYAQSIKDVFALIEATRLEEPWQAEKNSWFIRVVTKVVGMLFVSTTTSERSKVLYEGLKANGVDEGEAVAAAKVIDRTFKP